MATELTHPFLPFESMLPQFRCIMESLNEALVLVDDMGAIRYVNHRFVDLTGFDEEEILGKRIFEVYFPVGSAEYDAEARVMVERWAARRRGESDVYETEIVRKDGKRRWIETRAAPLYSSSGEIVGSIGAVSDTTEKKLLEEELRWSQKMEAVGRLAGGVAHDFNNLLTVIQGYGELLKSELPADDPNQRKLDVIKEASEAAALLTQQLLSLSKRQVLNIELIDLSEIVENSLRVVQGIIGERIELVADLAQHLPLVSCDISQFQQVILNLVVNARDAMPSGGNLLIETILVDAHGVEIESPDSLPPKSFVQLRVTDTGTGMDEATRQRIFEPFFSTKGHGGGSGLGLTVTFGIVGQHGGHIRVQSELGRGTRFDVSFPAVELRGAVTKRIVRPISLEGSEVILVAEDNMAVRVLLCETLDRYGYTVLPAKDGKSAIELVSGLTHLTVDLLVTDLVMPGMGGLQLVEKIQEMSPQAKAMIVSGCPEELTDRVKLESCGLPFLAKPFTPEGLASFVRSVLDSKLESKRV